MRKFLGFAAIAAPMQVLAGMALSAGEGRVHATSGRVLAIAEGSKTIVAQSRLGGKPWIIGTEVTDQTRFGAQAKTLQDVKPGDTGTIRWVREESGLTARSVTLRKVPYEGCGHASAEAGLLEPQLPRSHSRQAVGHSAGDSSVPPILYGR